MWDLLERQIGDIVARYPHQWQPTRWGRAAAEVAFSGGAVWKGESPAGSVALRCWPAGYDPRRLGLIHRLLVTAQRRGCRFVPQPIANRQGETFHRHAERLWELCTWRPGEPVRAAPTDAQLRSALQALAAWHACFVAADFEGSGTLFGPANLGQQALSPGFRRRVREWRRLRSLQRRLMEKPAQRGGADPRDLIARTVQAVERLAPRVEEWLSAPHTVRMSLCLRDVHREHVLFTGEEVTGLIDFGAVGIDTAACDLGRLLGSLIPDDPVRWQAAIAQYRQHGELSDEAEALVWRFDATGVVLGALHWLEWLVIERRKYGEPAAALGRWEQLVLRMERWLQTGQDPHPAQPGPQVFSP